MFTGVALPQQLTVGFIGGTHLTDNFPGEFSSYGGDAYNFPSTQRFDDGPRTPILGGFIELRLSGLFSVEADVLHRPVQARITYTETPPGGTPQVTRYDLTAFRAWQFPVLFKYTLPGGGRFRPFVAVGPSFRTQEDASGTEPSQVGITAGAGATLAWKRLRVTPTLRYTRWQRDPVEYPRRASRQDQVEILTSFGVDAGAPHWRAGRHRVALGAVAGLPLGPAFAPEPWPWQGERPPELFRYMAGLATQVNFGERWGVAANLLYKPLRARSDNPERRQAYSVLTWVIPVLAKRYWGGGRWRPFAEAGPSFRLSGNLNGYRPSPVGVTAGGGVERRLAGGARWWPEVRYTRWREDGAGPRTEANAVEVLAGFTF